jgi:hypothetical protein
MQLPRFLLLSILLFAVLGHSSLLQAGVYQTIYVKPTGNDSNDGSSWALAKKTIGGAQTRVRSLAANMPGDIEVVLGEGTYFTNGTTFTFTDADSGQNGWRIVWRNEPGKNVVLSAGKKITDTWVQYSPSVYHTSTAYMSEIRQLYVNGVHEFFASTDVFNNDATVNTTDKYIEIPTAHMPYYTPVHPVEIVVMAMWTAKVSQFTTTSDAATGKTRLYPTAPHFFDYKWEFSATAKHAYYFQRSGNFFSINQGFYHRPSEYIWYSKPASVDLGTAEVIVPSEQEVLRVAGTNTTTARAHDLVFSGLSFEHTNWTAPSVAANGFVGNQAGALVDGNGVVGMIPGGVVVLNAFEVDFEHCTFQRMGGAGLDLRGYVDQCRVAGCHFNDICGNALLLWPNNSYSPLLPSNPQVQPNVKGSNYVDNCFVSDNLVENCGAEYYDAVGIFMRYGSFNSFLHNEVRSLPYSGISIGWGWGGQNAAPMRDNWCNFNHVHHVMDTLKDGSGIYTLDDQNDGLGTTNWLEIGQNNVHDITLSTFVTPGAGAAGIYLDQGSNHIRVERNIIAAIDAPADHYIFDHSLITDGTKALDIINNNTGVDYVDDYAGPRPGYDSYAPPSAYSAERDIAPLCRAYASSSYADNYWPDRATDQRSTTLWASAAGDPAPKFTVDFQRNQRITKVTIVSRQDTVVNDGTRRNFNVYGWSGARGTGTKTPLGAWGATPFPQQGSWTQTLVTPASFQSLTVEKTDGAHFNFSALQIFSDN